VSGGVIERVVTRLWGRGRRAAEDTTDHRAQLLELCLRVQHATSVWGPTTHEPLCIDPGDVDDFWRAVLVLVQDGPPSQDESLYRYVLGNLQPMAAATLAHAEAARAARAARDEWDTDLERRAEQGQPGARRLCADNPALRHAAAAVLHAIRNDRLPLCVSSGWVLLPPGIAASLSLYLVAGARVPPPVRPDAPGAATWVA
jgi:hypothetical protein